MRIFDIWEGEDHDDNVLTVRDILQRDDVKQFDEFVSCGRGYVEPHHYPALLDMCFQERANQCTLYLLQGNLPHGPPDVSNQKMHDRGDSPALFKAVGNLWDPQVYNLLIYHCGAYHHANLSLSHGCLPLHLLLHNLVERDRRLTNWSLDNSLTKLLLYLFLQPLVKPKLDCARLVAQVTDSINEVALGFIQHGEIIQLASLLLVAREKAMAPFCSGETIKQHASLEWLASHVYRGQCSRATIAASGLLYVLEKAGDALASFHQCMPNNVVEVSVKVAQIMHEAGIKVTYNDFDLEEIYSSGIKAEVLRSIQERLDIAFDDTFKNFEMSKKSTVSLPRIIDGGLSPVNHKAQAAAKQAKLEHLGSKGHKYPPSNNVGNWMSSWAYQLPNLTMKLKKRVRLV